MKKKIDWALLQARIGHSLSADDAQILRMLTEGMSTPQIAALRGVSRSRVFGVGIWSLRSKPRSNRK